MTTQATHAGAHLTTPFSRPPAMTLTDIPSGWLEKATEQMSSLQCTWPIRSPFTVHRRRSLPPPTEGDTGAMFATVYITTQRRGRSPRGSPESQTVAMSPDVSLADTAVTGLLCPARLWT